MRQIIREAGVLLLFDEVVTGFRLGLGGAQEYYDVIPDLVTYGKAIGGGFPIGAVGCSAEMMSEVIDGDMPISMAGTFSGNPVTLTAGNATLGFLRDNPQVYDEMAAKGDHMRSSFNEFAQRKGLPATTTGAASLSQVHFREPPVSNPRNMLDQDHKALHDFQLYLRHNGVFTPRIH